MTNNLKINKDQINEAINNETVFGTSSFNLSSGTSNPLPVVNVSLQGRNKHIATTVTGLTLLWDNRDTNIMIKRRHNKHYEHMMWYNKRVLYNS